MHKLVLVRHGESTWNQLNKFTGWHDVELTKNGENEARIAAISLKKEKFLFDCAYTSVLKRAIHTLWIMLNHLQQPWLSVKKTWCLNERHYGALEGLNKNDIIMKYGEQKVMEWRRSFNISPPKIKITDTRFPGNDLRYAHLDIKNIPTGESLEVTANRVIPYWNNHILPKIQDNKKILIVAHGNSLRALIQYLKKINNRDILQLNIPTAVPIVLEFNKNWSVKEYYFLQ